MKKLLLLILILSPVLAEAQVPKMYIRLFGGTNTTDFVYRAENETPDRFLGWQVGGAFRVGYRKRFFETGVTFVNSGITIETNQDTDIPVTEPIDLRIRSLEVPLTVGYVPVKEAIFKWFVYGGLVNKFSMKGRFTYLGETISFKPGELDLHWYNLGARAGTQIDIAFFNFDLSYTIGITNAIKNRVRTNAHSIELTAGLLF